MGQDKIWVIRSRLTDAVVGAAASHKTAVDMANHPNSRLSRGYTIEVFVKEPAPEIPRGFVGTVSMDSGLATLESGATVNLLKVQATLNGAFSLHGDQEYATAADQLSTITGLVQGPHGEWVEA